MRRRFEKEANVLFRAIKHIIRSMRCVYVDRLYRSSRLWKTIGKIPRISVFVFDKEIRGKETIY